MTISLRPAGIEDATALTTLLRSLEDFPFLILKGPEGFVSELFVHPYHRGDGIGKRLLEHARQEAAKRGCARMGLINFRNKESYQRAFYAKNGWVERQEAANFVLPMM